jgi:WXG100 family type VII secretion target
MIGTNFPVEGIETLATKVSSEAEKLRGELNALYSACQRDPSFNGAAAQRYDDYLKQWQTAQGQLVDALQGAARILTQLGTTLRETDQAVARAFG